MTSKVKKGSAKKISKAQIAKLDKAADKEIEAANEKARAEIMAKTFPEPKPAKNIETLPDGTQILVRGPEKVRAGYIQGNVGWQDFLRPARLALNLCTYAIKIGASDKVIASLKNEADKAIAKLNEARVKIPSDMTTQAAQLAVITEANVGSPDYVIATRKLSGLVKFVADPTLAKSVGAELLSAQLALKASK